MDWKTKWKGVRRFTSTLFRPQPSWSIHEMVSWRDEWEFMKEFFTHLFGRKTPADELMNANQRMITLTNAVPATKALLHFCRTHNRNDLALEPFEHCLKALEAKDLETAQQIAQDIPLGTMGCFDDWGPRGTSPGETNEHAYEVFRALVMRWSFLLKGKIPRQ